MKYTTITDSFHCLQTFRIYVKPLISCQFRASTALCVWTSTKYSSWPFSILWMREALWLVSSVGVWRHKHLPIWKKCSDWSVALPAVNNLFHTENFVPGLCKQFFFLFYSCIIQFKCCMVFFVENTTLDPAPRRYAPRDGASCCVFNKEHHATLKSKSHHHRYS